jgi:hypothetical protein
VVHGGNVSGRIAGQIWMLSGANGDGAPAWRRLRRTSAMPALQGTAFRDVLVLDDPFRDR